MVSANCPLKKTPRVSGPWHSHYQTCVSGPATTTIRHASPGPATTTIRHPSLGPAIAKAAPPLSHLWRVRWLSKEHLRVQLLLSWTKPAGAVACSIATARTGRPPKACGGHCKDQALQRHLSLSTPPPPPPLLARARATAIASLRENPRKAETHRGQAPTQGFSCSSGSCALMKYLKLGRSYTRRLV